MIKISLHVSFRLWALINQPSISTMPNRVSFLHLFAHVIFFHTLSITFIFFSYLFTSLVTTLLIFIFHLWQRVWLCLVRLPVLVPSSLPHCELLQSPCGMLDVLVWTCLDPSSPQNIICFFPKTCVHTEGFLQYVKAGAWSGCSLWSRIFPVNFHIKWLLRNVDMHFDCAGSHKVCGSRFWGAAFFW